MSLCEPATGSNLCPKLSLSVQKIPRHGPFGSSRLPPSTPFFFFWQNMTLASFFPSLSGFPSAFFGFSSENFHSLAKKIKKIENAVSCHFQGEGVCCLLLEPLALSAVGPGLRSAGEGGGELGAELTSRAGREGSQGQGPGPLSYLSVPCDSTTWIYRHCPFLKSSA